MTRRADDHPRSPAGLWKRLAALAGVIQDGETKAQYLADWRARFDQAFPPAPPGLNDDDMLPDGRQSTVSTLGERDARRLKDGRGGLAAAIARMGAGNAGEGRALGLGRRPPRHRGPDRRNDRRRRPRSTMVAEAVLVEKHPDVRRRRLPAIVRHRQARGFDLGPQLLT
jgi:hypothetical protein